MFNRNEWLQWAKTSQQNNPTMKDFRNGYWKNIQEESNSVDEGIVGDIFRSATGKEKGKPLTRKQLSDKVREHGTNIKNYLTKDNYENPKKAGAEITRAATQAMVWTAAGRPSKKEKEAIEKSSPTRLGTQQSQMQQTDEQILKPTRSSQINMLNRGETVKKQESMRARLERMQREKKKLQTKGEIRLNNSIEYRMEELGLELNEIAFLAPLLPLLGAIKSTAAAALPAIAGVGKAALGSKAAIAAGTAGRAALAHGGRAAMAAGRGLSRTGGYVKKGLVGPKSTFGKFKAKSAAKKSFTGPPKPKAGIKKLLPSKKALKGASKEAGKQAMGGAAMAGGMSLLSGKPKVDTTVQSNAPQQVATPPATGADANARERARQQRMKFPTGNQEYSIAASFEKIPSKNQQQLNENSEIK